MASLLNMSGGSLLGKGLPYDAEIEYLESSGTQYIDTGIYPDNTYTFDTKIAVLNRCYNCIYWGCRTAGNPSSYNSQCYLNSNTSGSGGTDDASRIHLYSTSVLNDSNWDSGIIPSVGVMYSFTGITVVGTMLQMSYPIVLFGFNNTGSVNSSAGVCRIRLFTAYSNGNPVLDLIPVVKDGVGYMYDKVSGQLFGNAGTGSFIVGPRVS